MKIATLCDLPPPTGGAETLSKQLALNFDKLGNDVFIVTHRIFEVRMTEDFVQLCYAFDWRQQSILTSRNIKIYPTSKKVLVYDPLDKCSESLDRTFIRKVQSIFQDREGDLWFGTSGGVSRHKRPDTYHPLFVIK